MREFANGGIDSRTIPAVPQWVAATRTMNTGNCLGQLMTTTCHKSDTIKKENYKLNQSVEAKSHI